MTMTRTPCEWDSGFDRVEYIDDDGKPLCNYEIEPHDPGMDACIAPAPDKSQPPYIPMRSFNTLILVTIQGVIL